MAITFSKSISITKLLNAYNNNVVEFTSDAIPGGESISKATINLGGIDFEITPISNVLHFNFKEVIKVLINDNNHADPILPTSNIEVDNTLNESELVTYTITFSDDSTEQTTRTYVFVKSVEQIANVSNRLLTEQQILTPLNLTFFNGYPFDVAHYSDGDITLTNTATGVSGLLSSTATNTDRIFLSLGDSLYLDSSSSASQFQTRVEDDGGTYEVNTCWLATLLALLNLGVNTITVVGTTTETLTIFLSDLCSGTYLKWVNPEGGWSYWLFNPIHIESVATKTKDVFNVDFESIDNTYATRLITGKDSVKPRQLLTERLSQSEILQVASILDSPRVELYNGESGDAITVDSWQTVLVEDGTFVVDNTKSEWTKLKITIDINKYTQ